MDPATSGQLAVLRTDECWRLLTTIGVGRVAWTTADGPVVIPVNFAVDGDSVHVRTSAYSSLVLKADAERVAFEADRIDEAERTGWSVLARGRAEVRYGVDADRGPAGHVSTSS
jgi:nitroimidazol reductase NimA-like FMN-containing flavoprotein (pyridoxamine 5'-phosphate oxidase superfamily)